MYRLIEGTIKTEFMGAGVVFVTKSGKVLILKKPKGPWGMPGGKPAYGELPEEAALRETYEETGIKVEDVSKPIVIYYRGKKYYSFFKLIDKKIDIQLSKEHKNYKWVPYDELKNIKLIPPIKENLDLYLKEIKRHLY